ncbi:MAG: hypothetical protein WAU78_04480 [Roseiarcus sp.]
MAGDDPRALVDQDGRVEAERFDAIGDLADLDPQMPSRIARVGNELFDRHQSQFSWLFAEFGFPVGNGRRRATRISAPPRTKRDVADRSRRPRGVRAYGVRQVGALAVAFLVHDDPRSRRVELTRLRDHHRQDFSAAAGKTLAPFNRE